MTNDKMPEIIYANPVHTWSLYKLPASNKGEEGKNSRKCLPRTKYTRSDRYDRMKEMCERLAVSVEKVAEDGFDVQSMREYLREAITEYAKMKGE